MLKNKLIWLGPISVLAFVVLLTVMYDWVGKIESIGVETPEVPEMSLAKVQVPAQVDNRTDRRQLYVHRNGHCNVHRYCV